MVRCYQLLQYDMKPERLVRLSTNLYIANALRLYGEIWSTMRPSAGDIRAYRKDTLLKRAYNVKRDANVSMASLKSKDDLNNKVRVFP